MRLRTLIKRVQYTLDYIILKILKNKEKRLLRKLEREMHK